ncbi:MAG: WG repeat-containing protein [Planctomycetota bacterium]
MTRCFAPLLALAFMLAPLSIASAQDTIWFNYYRFFSRNSLVLDNARPGSELFPAQLDGRWGLIDQRGLFTFLPEFLWTDDGVDGRARAIADNGKTGFINGVGDWLIEPRFEWVDRFFDDLAIFREGEREGFIDQRGRVVMPPTYEAILRFNEEYAAVQRGGRIGFVNRALKEVIEPQFAVARSFHDGLAAVRFLDRDGQPAHWGYIDVRGKVKWQDTSGRITELRDFNENLAAFQMLMPDGSYKFGYLSQGFDVAIPPQFDQARDFTDKLAAVAQIGNPGDRNGWGYINRAGQWELAPQFDWADDFDDRLAMIRFRGLYGFIDREGATGLFPEFAVAEPFERGFATLSDGTHMAYVTTDGGVSFDPADLTRAQPRNSGEILGRRGVSLRGTPILDRTSGTRSLLLRFPRSSAVPQRTLIFRGDDANFPVPYEPEFLYEERLPRDTPDGLLDPDKIEGVPLDPAYQVDESLEDPNVEKPEPSSEGVIPEPME